MVLGCATELSPPRAAPRPTPSQQETAEPTPLPSTGLWSGEHLVADVAVKGVTVGEYRLTVAGPCALDGRAVMPVYSKAEHRGLLGAFAQNDAVATSWLDLETGYPVETISMVESPRSTKHFEISYGNAAFQFIYHRQSKRNSRKFRHASERKLPPHVPGHDMHSALGVMRTWAGKIGKRGSIYTVFGKRLWRVDAKVVAKEELTVGDKSFQSIRIEGTARTMSFELTPNKRVYAWALWVSDEAARLPLKATMQSRDGIVQAELINYEQRPVTASTLPACER
jgi:hypothetical protein